MLLCSLLGAVCELEKTMEDELIIGELQDAIAETNERLTRIETQQAVILKAVKAQEKHNGKQ